jgi:hypothetical protein
VRHEIVEEDDDRVRIRVEYIVPSGSKSDDNYPMLGSDREQGFFVLARAPSRSRLAVNVYVRSEQSYSWEVESATRILEGNFNVSVLNIYYPEERFSVGGGGDVAN